MPVRTFPYWQNRRNNEKFVPLAGALHGVIERQAGILGVKHRVSLDQIPDFITPKPIEDVKRKFGLTRIIKLAGNENSMGTSPLAKEAIRHALDDLWVYPDIGCTRLREKLAASLRVEPEHLIFGNGSFELISLVGQTYLNPGDEAIIPQPTFGWYKSVVLQAGAAVVSIPLREHRIDLDDVLGTVTPRTRAIFLCNPNNPTGTYYGSEAFGRFLGALPDDILVVVDEAYIDFVRVADFPDALAYLCQYPNLISLRTFSKVYGLAGQRIGYGIASPEVISALNRVRMPANVNAAAQEAALASLDDINFRQAVLRNNERGRALYYDTLTLWGLDYLPTQCNFLMFRTGLDGDYLAGEFLKRGILLRSGAEFGMNGWLRVTIGLYKENELVLKTLRKLLDSEDAAKHRVP